MRTRGLGRVYRRGRTWWVQYSFRGRRYRESSGSTRRGDAVRLLRQRLEEMGRGRLLGPALERTTFGDLAQGLLDDYRVNGRKSLPSAQGAIKALGAMFGGCLAREITFDRLNAYVAAQLEAGRRPATVRNHLALLKRAFRLAERAGRAVCPPFPTLTVRNVRTGFLEEADVRAVLAHLPPDLQPVVEFAFLTGWRRGEVLGLQWRHVDFAAGTVHLDPGTTRNAEGRTFPFAALPALAELLRRQRARTVALEQATGQIIPWVFHRQGRPIRDFRAAWARACQAAGQPGRLFHDLRRSCVRRLERAGVPRSVAMRLTGHRTEAVYRRYAIAAEADLVDGVRKLAALPPASPTPAVVPLPERKGTVGAQSPPSASGRTARQRA